MITFYIISILVVCIAIAIISICYIDKDFLGSLIVLLIGLIAILLVLLINKVQDNAVNDVMTEKIIPIKCINIIESDTIIHYKYK